MDEGCQILGLSDIDRTQLLQFFFHEYMQSVINDENSAWVPQANSAFQYMNDMRKANISKIYLETWINILIFHATRIQ